METVLTFGEYVKQARKEAGLTLKEVAEASELVPSYIHRIETGERENCSVPTMIALVKALNLDIMEALKLFGYES